MSKTIDGSVQEWPNAEIARAQGAWGGMIISAAGFAVVAAVAIAVFGLTLALGSGVIPVAFLTTVIALVLVCLFFYELLRRPAIHGRRTTAEIEGFRMYSKTAGTDRLTAIHPPEKTPELFEKHLPYALALGVEHEWAESFTQMLIAAANDPTAETSHEPVWYRPYGVHHQGGFNFAALTSSISSSLTTSIASASTPPGSSSGFGDSGGGFS